MKNIFMDSGIVSLKKQGESLCGDYYTMVKNEDTTTMVLSDGLGSGVKANILATLTAKILSTMMAGKMGIEESIYTMAKTLPVCKVRKLAYATFTVLQLNAREELYMAQFDNPEAIFLRNGKCYDYNSTCKIICDKEIYESNIRLQTSDVLVVISDGVTSAGLGGMMKNGWQRKDIISFIEGFYTEDIAPQTIAANIADACLALCQGEPQDDITVVVYKMRPRTVVNLMIGPPENKNDDNSILKLFFSKEGKKIICGGTTAKTVSKYLHRPITAIRDTGTEEIPARSQIEGVDLVTEGIVTLRKVVELARIYDSELSYSLLNLKDKTDGATLIFKMLFEYATDINFFVGKAVNPAHQLPDMAIDHHIKLELINELEEILLKTGKNVKVSFC